MSTVIHTMPPPSVETSVAASRGPLPCREANEDLWFAEQPADIERAKKLCAACPLQKSCLAGAQERAEPCGVWGGQLFISGQIVARKRPRGRPRKERTVVITAAA